MIIRIEDAETCRLAKELAQLTGETITGAVTSALREHLTRERQARDTEALIRDLEAISQECAAGLETGPSATRRGAGTRFQALKAIAQRCAARLGPGPSAVEHGDFLYDERGLPK